MAEVTWLVATIAVPSHPRLDADRDAAALATRPLLTRAGPSDGEGGGRRSQAQADTAQHEADEAPTLPPGWLRRSSEALLVWLLAD